jgi:hypothetical protein
VDDDDVIPLTPNLVPNAGPAGGSLQLNTTGSLLESAEAHRPANWKEFGEQLHYLPEKSTGYDHDPDRRPPVLLPYWDKRVEKGLWLDIWKRAAAQLRRTNSLIIWGYSLPATDLKARELIRLAFRPGAELTKVAVIDRSADTQDRWRAMFLDKEFWRFESCCDFREFLTRHGTNLAPFRYNKAPSNISL